jgi:hypothetical protein
MPHKTIELPPAVAGRFVEDMRACRAERHQGRREGSLKGSNARFNLSVRAVDLATRLSRVKLR